MPLDVTAQLSLSDKSGKEISLCAQNGVVSIVLPSLWAQYPFKKPFVERRQRESLLRVLHQGLQDIDLNIDTVFGTNQIAKNFRMHSKINYQLN